MAVDSGDDTDPENPQSWNKYAYVRNNPLGRTDPTGTKEYLGPLPYKPPQVQSAGQIKAFAEGVGRIASSARNGALLAAGVNAVVGDEPGAVMALGGAGVCSLAKTGADLLAAAADFSPDTTQEVGIDLVEHAGSAAVGYVLDKAAPGAGDLVKETAKEAIPAAATALATAVAGANDAPAATDRPLIITTKEAEAQPVIRNDEKK